MIGTNRWVDLVRENTLLAIRAFNDGTIPDDAVPAIAVPWNDGTKSVTFLSLPDEDLRELADGGEPAMAAWLAKARTGDFEGFTMIRPERRQARP